MENTRCISVLTETFPVNGPNHHEHSCGAALREPSGCKDRFKSWRDLPENQHLVLPKSWRHSARTPKSCSALHLHYSSGWKAEI